MKTNVDKAIEILTEYVKLDRSIREGNTESDYSKFCEEKCEAIESLIEYIFASRCAFKTSNAISKKVKEVEDANVTQLNETDLKKILVCLGMATYIEADDLTKEQRNKVVGYNIDIEDKIWDILGISTDDVGVNIDIETLKFKDYHEYDNEDDISN